MDGLGEVSILVPESARQARELLAAGEQGRLELNDTDAARTRTRNAEPALP
jgi:hypothetical protein